MTLDELTFEVLDRLVGTSFFADAAGHRVELRIVQVRKVMESQAARLKRTPFSIYLLGPSSYPLQQLMYPMSHETFDEPLPIFIVPVGQVNEGYLYEAVFT